MPEGDTIWRTAERLRPALAGKTIARFEAPRLPSVGPKPGTTIDSVAARGKYLLVHFADGTTLETHMKMTGSWHLYRTGERWRKSPRGVRALIETTEGWQAVCFHAPVVDLVARRNGPDHLGPDLTGPSPDLDAAAERFSLADADTPIGVVLLDQRICCGVGNVYKSEVLHAHQLDPRTPVSDVGPDERRAIVATAHRLLRANLGGGRRITVPRGPGAPDGLAVYGRAGEACPRCGAVISRIVQGEHARSTYVCVGCQLRPTEDERGAKRRTPSDNRN